MTLQDRTNQALRQAESWQPPAFAAASTGWVSRAVAALRRALDLQAASIWNDLREQLPRWQGVVLDVGCGAQPYRTLLDPGVRYIGIDAREAEAFGYSMPDTLYFDSGGDWPVGDASVDALLATETLEHIPDPSAFLRQAARVLKPGGILLLTVPFSARYHYIPYDYWRYTPAGLVRLLTTDFSDHEVYARGNSVTVACYKCMALILPLLLPQKKPLLLAMLSRAVGLFLLPALLVLAAVAHFSLRGRGGDDCLGYTVLARRK